MVDHKPGRAVNRGDARVDRSRAALRAALLALLNRRRFEDLTIRAITARAGVGYATFFRHYPDKRALLHDVAATAIGELLARAMPIAAADDSRGACLVLCRYVHGQRRLWRALLNGGAAATVRDEFLRQARAMVPANPLRRPGFPPTSASPCLRSARSKCSVGGSQPSTPCRSSRWRRSSTDW